MSGLITVCLKEIVDNFRDRRSLVWSVLFGPLFGPVLFAVMTAIAVDRTVESVEETLQLPVVGAAYAPNLVRFLEHNRVEIQPAPQQPEQAVRSGDIDMVLVIGADFGEKFAAGLPAPTQLVVDQSDSHAAAQVARARGLLHAYSAQLGALRLQVRGVHPATAQPLLIEEIDVSTPTGRAVMMLGMMTYFILFSMLMGGMYLAIDTTAGERERGSLEALLTVPVPRSHLIVGKICATAFYMTVSLAITVTVFAIMLPYVPLEELGMTTQFSAGPASLTVLVMLPFVLVGAGMMTLVASFTRSYKEAQTWLSVILLVPTLPILFAALQALRPSLLLMTVPSLSQHLLVTEIIRHARVDPLWLAVSVLTTLLTGLVLIRVAVVMYGREKILG